MREHLPKPYELKIRPHHGLCAEFFAGEGYDGGFVQNMSAVLSMLNETDPTVTLADGVDMICAGCPHNIGNSCESAEKVSRYDGAVLNICGLSAGDSMHWQEFRDTVRKRILSEKRLAEICGDCCWYEICGK